MTPRTSFLARLLPAVLALAAVQTRAGEPVNFNRDIRPILNAHCFKCHGGVKEAGGLNLQFREKALLAGETGEIAIVPGKPEESAFYHRLVTDDKTDRMPKKEEPLPKEKIALLKRWIAEGANWQNHWAYDSPKAAGKTIDEIVTTRLQQEKLTLSAETDFRTLARRLSLDLTGLPPSSEEVEILSQSKIENRESKIEQLVDKLLASPAYGERWATPWLDLARYADSRGYEADRFRDMWRYRDWVVDALNADMPYDRFVTEQLAGDILPNAKDGEIIATAYHRNTPQNDEGGTDDEEFRTYAVLDRLNSTFDALQGTSIGCVQCHGHPYDPFVHQEYYELMAFFNNTADADRGDQAPTRKFRSPADTIKAGEIGRDLAAQQARLDEEIKRGDLRKAFDAWLGEVNAARKLAPLADVAVESTQGKYVVEKETRVRLEQPAPDRTTIAVSGTVSGTLGSLALEVLPDPSLPSKGPGASDGAGNFILTRVLLSVVERASPSGGFVQTPVELKSATATFEQEGWPVAEAIKLGPGPKKEGEGGWAIAGGAGKSHTATFTFAKPLTLSPDARLSVVLECENERWGKHVLGSFRVASASGVLPENVASFADAARKLLEKDPSKWKPEERATVERAYFVSVQPELTELYKVLDGHRAALAALPECDLPIMQELESSKSRKTLVFERGNWMTRGAEVQPKTPQILNAWHDDYPRNRLGFAQWLTNGENPLTARVQVNRVWEQLFGVGLVETLEDFGSQGDKPIYQDLLDELAVRFQGPMKWSQKALVREIVLSRVYRQSSRATRQQVERDPANRLLARGPRFRLGNEQIRDQALAIGGILSSKMGGRPVMPYQPPGTWLTPYEGTDWKTSAGEDSHRRALYTLIRRSATYPSMITFDAPNREFCVVRRVRTNTPLQSLDLLNSPVFMEAAAGLAKRMTEPGGELDEQLARGLALATFRPARDYEVATLRELHSKVGGNMTLVANAILNLDEVLTKN
jgi:hypothetical protein